MRSRTRALARWFAAGRDWETPLAEVDLRPGGRYRLAMRSPTSPEDAVTGVYLEVARPARLSFTWSWDGEGHEHGSTCCFDNLVRRAFAAVAS